MIAADIALAFNTANERKSWTARPHAKSATGRECVHFTAPSNLVTLVLDCETARFAVRFNRYHATWGDYIHSIARSLLVVLSTLKAAGLPFEAPASVDGIEVIATAGDAYGPGGGTWVRWPGADPFSAKGADTPEG